MTKRSTRQFIFTLCMVLLLGLGAFSTRAEEELPIEFSITYAAETQLETTGVVDSVTFTITNKTDAPYTLYHTKLSGGFDGEVRALNDEIVVEAKSTREFSLTGVAVTDEQLDQDIVFTLTWDELVPSETDETPEAAAETPKRDEKTEEEDPETAETEETPSPEADTPKPTATQEPVYVQRSLDATVRIERFVPPELIVTVSTSENSVAPGNRFTVTYTIKNETKYDMSGVMLTDDGVYEGAIPIQGTELMSGASITVPIEYEMRETDMVFHPVVSFVASQRQYESRPAEPVIVSSVITSINIEVEQYPSNVEGSTFAITITNTGNQTIHSLQLYDEINTEIDEPFDLAAGQQKVLTFNVPSAYAAGLIRSVRFRVTGIDYFGDYFSYTDDNSYDCIPYITSESVRLSLLASLKRAYYDDAGKLCGEILIEIRNYSDVQMTEGVLSELTVFGTLENYRELQRGESFYTANFQLDGIREVQFRATAKDPTGQVYATDIVPVDLSQLETLAKTPEGQMVVYKPNTLLTDLAQKVTASMRDVLLVLAFLVLLSTTICLGLWYVEERYKEKLPKESLLSIVVPENKNIPQGSLDQVLNSSPAEQLGYTAPAKMRYGSTTVKTTSHDPKKSRFAPGGRAASAKQKEFELYADPEKLEQEFLKEQEQRKNRASGIPSFLQGRIYMQSEKAREEAEKADAQAAKPQEKEQSIPETSDNPWVRPADAGEDKIETVPADDPVTSTEPEEQKENETQTESFDSIPAVFSEAGNELPPEENTVTEEEIQPVSAESVTEETSFESLEPEESLVSREDTDKNPAEPPLEQTPEYHEEKPEIDFSSSLEETAEETEVTAVEALSESQQETEESAQEKEPVSDPDMPESVPVAFEEELTEPDNPTNRDSFEPEGETDSLVQDSDLPGEITDTEPEADDETEQRDNLQEAESFAQEEKTESALEEEPHVAEPKEYEPVNRTRILEILPKAKRKAVRTDTVIHVGRRGNA